MYTVVVALHIVACVALILIVLLQTGRGAEMGAAFGGASQTLFGGGGSSTFFGKLTTTAAVIFMCTCLGLTYLSSTPSSHSIMQNLPPQHSQGPVLPEAQPVAPAPAQPKASPTASQTQKGAKTTLTPAPAASHQQSPASKTNQ